MIDEFGDLPAHSRSGNVGAGLLVKRVERVSNESQLGRPVPIDGTFGDASMLSDSFDGERCVTLRPEYVQCGTLHGDAGSFDSRIHQVALYETVV